ncbi:MAG: bifunctional phosphoribosylaminoimidazolecarboxamide formyltransferase/IMP cyclohydrolase [Candidatus Omnitrophota bacterium]
MEVKRALVSVSDKTGLEKLVKGLDSLGIEILSTGGTAKFINELGIQVTEVASYTGFPEMMDGRVKTLHPKIHAGLLALRENADHMRQAKEHDILLIDMVVVNLYPFENVISKGGTALEEAVENIDIGGPSMLRSAAKNFRSVAVVSSTSQYDKVLAELERGKRALSEATLRELAVAVFEKTSRYDNCISNYLSGVAAPARGEGLPGEVNISLEKIRDLRYGENPHQKGALYRDAQEEDKSIIDAEQIQGKQLSFNNILDLSVATEIVKSFDSPAVSIIKHNNPCGAAIGGTLKQAFLDALDCDRMSAFGSIMGFNAPIDGALAKAILDEVDFVECIIAPEYDPEALKIFKAKKNLRILKSPFLEQPLPEDRKDFKKIPGGFLVQDTDSKDVSRRDLKVVTKEKPQEALIDSLLFGWKVVRFVKSNAILLCQGTKTVGIGPGQTSRVDSVNTAIRKAGERAKGAVLASDAFFPMPDSIEQAHKAGIAAIIQPGGSIKDDEVIAACDRLGLPMVFTGIRHFRH